MENNFNKLQDVIDAKILNERKVFLWGQVDDNSAKQVIDRLLYLELMQPGKEIQLIINSPDLLDVGRRSSFVWDC